MRPPIPILYEDPDIIVFNKPAGMVVVPEPKSFHTLTDIVNEQILPTEEGRLYPCHRLDRDTTGAIIFARGKTNQEAMMNRFRQGSVHKKYIAFVKGKVKHPAGEIKSQIMDYHEKKYSAPKGRNQTFGRGLMVNRGKLAITRYKVVVVKHHFTVVEVFPLTGRTNQIRIHMAEMGHPLLGERLYAQGKDFNVTFRRVALHSVEVGFKHPRTGAKITVESEVAKDMENFLSRY